jgi:hypothetical protein
MALRYASLPVHGAIIAFGVSCGMFLYLIARFRFSGLRLNVAEVRLVAVGGGLNVLALGLQFVAITTMAVGYFEAFKRAVGLFLSIAVGKILFAETVTPRKIKAGITMTVGAIAVLL